MNAALATSLGVSSVVRLRRDVFDWPAGTLALVVRQRESGRYRYEIMIPGEPLTFFQPADMLEVVPGGLRSNDD